jgi:pyruvate,water dikinase
MAESFATKRWRGDLEQWDREWKPAVIARLKALQAEDPATLSDADLAKHLGKCRESVLASVELHHRLNLCNMLPLGDYLVHAAQWTGLPARDLLAPMRGATPISLGAAPELESARAAIAADAESATLLASSQDPGAILAGLKARPGAVGEALRAWLDVVAWRIATGYDLSDRCAVEMPEILVGALRSGTITAATDPKADAVVLDRAPAEKRAELAGLLREARDTYRIRDERGYLNDAWAVGLARRAVLAAGERLAKAGRIAEPAHAIDLAPEEIESLVAGGPGPTREQVAERVAYRTGHTVADAPPLLGYPKSGPPPAEWLPPAAARGARAIGIVLSGMFDIAKDQAKESKKLKGLGASGAVREGIARVVRTPADFSRVQKGDVLIARNTAPSYNVLLPLLNGIVTDRGGLLSHAAIVAREYDLAAVVGCGDATEKIPDGARVRVDGGAGLVEVLS